MKRKPMLFLLAIAFLTFGFGITYSFFHTEKMGIVDKKIAKFIFNAEQKEKIELPISDLKPGDINEFEFMVANAKDEKISNVSIMYQLTLKTYHFMPLEIKLYKENKNFDLILTCDETYTRNANNELVCNSEIQEMSHSESLTDNYKLQISFPSEYNDLIYSNLVDYVDIEIKSWQKI